MKVAVTNVKGGVGKTTTAVYLAAVAARRQPVVLVDADPQGSAAEWLDIRPIPGVTVIEAPSERLVAQALARDGGVVIVDTPPGGERVVRNALGLVDVAVVPTRSGALEVSPVNAVLGIIPESVHYGLVVTAARTFTRDYHDTMAAWAEAGVPVWGTVPERVAVALGSEAELAPDALDAYQAVWRTLRRRSNRS